VQASASAPPFFGVVVDEEMQETLAAAADAKICRDLHVCAYGQG